MVPQDGGDGAQPAAVQEQGGPAQAGEGHARHQLRGTPQMSSLHFCNLFDLTN